MSICPSEAELFSPKRRLEALWRRERRRASKSGERMSFEGYTRVVHNLRL
jgi:hypothetical protein